MSADNSAVTAISRNGPSGARDHHPSPSGQYSNIMHWDELSLPIKRALPRLLSGGSLRNVEPETVHQMRRLGLIEGDKNRERITPLGWELLRTSRDALTGSSATDRNAS